MFFIAIKNVYLNKFYSESKLFFCYHWRSWNLCKTGLPFFLETQWGRIVFIYGLRANKIIDHMWIANAS